MDRTTAYTQALGRAADFLQGQQYAMVGEAWTNQGFLGTATAVDGFTCTPTGPASLNVLLTPGAVYSLANLEATSWSSLPADLTKSIMKQGLMQSNDQIGLTPPGTVGQSQNFLIEVQYADLDTNPVLLPYYNAANPTQPYQGPGNSGASQNTARLGIAAVQVKAGTAATTGSQTTPAADAGWTGIFVVTLAQGQTTITAGNISQLAAAPFIPVKLPGIPAAIQASNWISFDDTGTANALVITPVPAISAYAKYQRFQVKVANANTSTVTININGLGAKAVTRADGSVCVAGDFAAAAVLGLVYDGAQFQIQNLAANNFQPRGATSLTSGSGNFTVPAGVTNLKVRVWSGGGGGGGIISIGAGAGGNGGAYSEGYFPVTPGQVIPYVVGAGGTAGGGGANGGTGGTSSFSPAGATPISCTGGGGGGAGSGGGGGSTGAASTATGANVINLQGFSGAAGAVSGSTFAAGGAGGAAPLSGPCFQPICLTGTVAGNGGAIPGGGAGGAAGLSGNASGGTGGRGQIIIEY